MIALEYLAVVCSGLFAGAAIYVNLVEHPARMNCGPALAHAEWIPSYRRATRMQAPLALVGGLSGIGAWIAGTAVGWLVSGLLLLSVVPFTLLVMLPTNKALLAIPPGQETERAAVLLGRWTRLHAVRTVDGTLSFAIFVGLLAR